MKTTHKILFINAVITGSFFLSFSDVAACSRYENYCADPNEECRYEGTVGPALNLDDGFVCRKKDSPFLGSRGARPGNKNNANLAPLPAGPIMPTVMPKTTLTCPNGYYLTTANTCTRIPDPCRGRIVPDVPQTKANVFEALWNFVTHKRQS